MSELLKRIRLPMKDGSMAELSLPDLLSMLGKLRFEHIDLRKFNNLPSYDPETVYFVYNPKLFKVYIGDRFVWFPELPKIEGELASEITDPRRCAIIKNSYGTMYRESSYKSDDNIIYIPYGKDLRFSMLVDDGVVPNAARYREWWGLRYSSQFSRIRAVFVNKDMKPCKMESLFEDATFLEEADLSLLDTTGVTTFNNMFKDSRLSKMPDLSMFDFSKVQTMESMFSGCRFEGAICIKKIDSPLLTTASGFMSGTPITSFSIDRWEAPLLNDMSALLSGCTSLEYADLSNINAPNIQSVEGLFSGCSSLKTFQLGKILKNAKYLKGVFRGCSALTSLNPESWGLYKLAYSCESMFENCTSLTEIDLSHWKIASSEFRCHMMFKGCSSLMEVQLPSVTFKEGFCAYMFEGCTALKSLSFSEFRNSAATLGGIERMFKNCTSLETLDMSSWDWTEIGTTSIGSIPSPFTNCTSLANLIFIKGFAHGDIDLHWSPLTHESALSVINSVGTQTKNYSIKFSAATFDTLTEEEIAIATSKGWTVVSA